VTFLFTDIEGSTRLSRTLGATAYGALLERHRALLRAAFEAESGVEVATEGDSFFVVFERAPAAVAAAVEAQRRLAGATWDADSVVRVRMGLHSGEGVLAGGSYVGNDVNRAARIAAAAHGGQVLVSETTSALVADALPAGVTLRGLGEHRLKDMRPERLCQLVVEGLAADFPRIRSLDAPRNNLPTQLTSFVGREAELADARELLSKARLLTLTGPGGTGKTRLSLELAARAADRFRDGVYFVPLEPITDTSLVPATIAGVLGLPDRGGRDPLPRLVEHLAPHHSLIVLDNVEQLQGVAGFVGELLVGAPGLTLLATSRAALRVRGELEYPVPPLGVPPAERAARDDAAPSEAVALFVERATGVRPSFHPTPSDMEAIAEICRRLDGLPLAIELAAARMKVLSPQAILARLGNRLALLSGGAQDLPARQQTLRGAIAWSHDLLDEADRRLFAALGVFVGGASLEAIDAVCGPEQQRDALDGVTSLVDKSLVRQVDGLAGEPRFTMLETIREFALEQLGAAGLRDEIRSRHAAWFRDVAEAAATTVMGATKRPTLDRLEQEHGNLRAALASSLETHDAATALRITTALWRFWQMRGYIDEGIAQLRTVLALPECGDYADLRLAALDAAGGLTYWRADYAAAREYYREALDARRPTGDRRAIAESLYNLSFPYIFQDDRADGRPIIEEAIRLFDEVGDEVGVARSKWGLANLEYASGHIERARELALASLATFESIGDAFMTGWTTYTVALSDLVLGRPDEARRRCDAALAIFAEAGDVSGYTLVLDTLSALALFAGDKERAGRIAGGVAMLERTTGTRLNDTNRSFFNYDPGPLRTDPESAAAYVEGGRMPVDDLVAYALGDR